MAIDYKWFEPQQNKSDLENVLDFIYDVPTLIHLIVENTSFISLVNKDEKYGVNFRLFYDAFNDSRYVLYEEVENKRFLISPKNEDYRQAIEENTIILNQIGFSGNSLRLKLGILTKLWENLVNASTTTIDFFSNPVIKLLRKFLEFLNSMLGSLTALIPGIDAIKEIKEVIESYLNLNEE